MSDSINRQAAIDALSEDVMGGLNYRRILQSLPSEDRPNIIECKDCEYWAEIENGVGYCHRLDNALTWFGTDATDYCSFGKRKEGRENG